MFLDDMNPADDGSETETPATPTEGEETHEGEAPAAAPADEAQAEM